MSERILIIRLGALGDLVLCFQAFQSIRNAHPKAEIALLTMPAFAPFARIMPWFDKVLVDPRAPGWRLDEWWSLRSKVQKFAPTRVYDLQGKFRQSALYYLLGGPLWGPEWSGAARGCSHPRLWPPVAGMHYTDFVAAQLQRAGVPLAGFVNMDWLYARLEAFPLPERYVLLIPGCAAARAYKRWPAERYAALAERLRQDGIGAVAIGTGDDAATILKIITHASQVVDLCRATSLPQVASLAKQAVCVVGNDTGPTHLAAAVGGRTVALMSDKVNPVWSAPHGPHAKWLQRAPLDELSVDTVYRAVCESLK